jgi:hypothetical protein
MTEDEKATFYSFYSYFEPEKLRTLSRQTVTRIDVAPAEIEQYVRAEVFQALEGDDDSNSLGMHFFFEPEPARKRKRLIQHTVDINDQTANPSLPGLFQKMEDRICEGLEGYGFCVDKAWFYQQIPLPLASRQFYAFRFGHRVLAQTSISTGQRQCVGVAQTIAKFVNRRVSDLMLAYYRTSGTARSTSEYIDNLRRREVSRIEACAAAKLLVKVCRHYNITLNESLPDILAQANALEPYDFIGVRYSPAEGKAGLTEKLRNKLSQLLTDVRELEAGRTRWSCEFADSVFGLLIHCSLVLRINTARFYYVFKFFRRRHAGTWKSHSDAAVWPCIVPVLEEWTLSLLKCGLVPWRRLSSEFIQSIPILITDASRSGYGITLFKQGKVSFLGAAWPEGTFTENINELEARVVEIAAEHFGLSQFHLIVDNTTALYSIQKGRSKSYRVNVIIDRLKHLLIVSVRYIQSHLNISDPWSRLFEDLEVPTASLPSSKAVSDRGDNGGARAQGSALEKAPERLTPYCLLNQSQLELL